MLKALQIQELVKGGEGYNVDFKRSVPSKVKEISDEVASFANAAGGYVLIGVDNNNQIIGAEIDNNKRSAIQDTIGEISPALRCEFYPVDVEGKQVWVIDVPSGKDKPYITGGVIYVREGANCQKLRSAEDIIRKSKCSTDFKRNDFLKKNEAYPLGALRSLKFAYRKLRISLFVELAV